METKRIAEVLYNLSCDMDYMDYADGLEETINNIEQLIYNISLFRDTKPLYELLEQIALVNEHTRDFVSEIRAYIEE